LAGQVVTPPDLSAPATLVKKLFEGLQERGLALVNRLGIAEEDGDLHVLSGVPSGGRRKE
jgi:hypothetical protein